MSFSNSDLNALRLAREERQTAAEKRLKSELDTNDKPEQFSHVEPTCKKARQEEIEKEIESESETGLVIIEEDEESDDEAVSIKSGASPLNLDLNALHLARNERQGVVKKRSKKGPAINDETGSSHVDQPVFKKARHEVKEKESEAETELVSDAVPVKRLISPLLDTLAEFSSLLYALEVPINLLRELLGENFEAYQENRGNDSKDLPIAEEFNPLFKGIIALNLSKVYDKVNLSPPPFIKLCLHEVEQAKAINDEHQRETHDNQLNKYKRLKALLGLLDKINEMKIVLPDEINKLNGKTEKYNKNKKSRSSVAFIKLSNEADTKLTTEVDDYAYEPIAGGYLPFEIWEKILKYFTGRDLMALKGVNKLANRFVNQYYSLENLKNLSYQDEYEKIIAEFKGECSIYINLADGSCVPHEINYGDIYLWALNKYLGKENFLKIEYFNQINASRHVLVNSLLNEPHIREAFYNGLIYIYLIDKNSLFLLRLLMRETDNLAFIGNALEKLVQKKRLSSQKARTTPETLDARQTEQQKTNKKRSKKTKEQRIQAQQKKIQEQQEFDTQEKKDFKLFVEFFPYLNKRPNTQLGILNEALCNAKNEYVIRYIIDNYPHFLSVSGTGRSGRYPIFMLFGSNNKKVMRERLINYIMEKSSPDLHRNYLHFLLEASYPYKNFRNLITDRFKYEDIILIARGEKFTGLPQNDGLHNLLKEKSSPIQYILYAIEQSKYRLENPMLRSLPPCWNEEKLIDVEYLRAHGHELWIAAFKGHYFNKEFLENKIELYLKSKLKTKQFKQLLNKVLAAKKEEAQKKEQLEKELVIKKEQLEKQDNIQNIIQMKQVEKAWEQLFCEVAQSSLLHTESDTANNTAAAVRYVDVGQTMEGELSSRVENSQENNDTAAFGDSAHTIIEQTERLLFLDLEIDFANSQMATVATSTTTFFNRANSNLPNHTSIDRTCTLPVDWRVVR